MDRPRRTIFTTDSSMSSDQEEMTNEEKNVQAFAKSMLQGRLFIGTFQEKRYVANLKAYRDVISINKDETDLLRDLDVVLKKIRTLTNRWIGITTPNIIGAPTGHCLWVELDNEIFGSYWYKIKSVKFKPAEVSIRLKQIRSVVPGTETQRKLIKQEKDKSTPEEASEVNFNFSGTIQYIKEMCMEKCSYFFRNIATIKNTKDAIIFISVVIMTLFTGTIQLIQYLGDFSLKLLRELSNLFKSVSPILVAGINMIGRSIAGLYMLIAMLWRDRKGPVTVYQSEYPRLTYNKNASLRGLPPPSYLYNQSRRTSGPIITEIHD